MCEELAASDRRGDVTDVADDVTESRRDDIVTAEKGRASQSAVSSSQLSFTNHALQVTSTCSTCCRRGLSVNVRHTFHLYSISNDSNI